MTSVQGTRSTRAGSRREPSTHGFRWELEGLRGLAAALVVVYHVWFGRVSGGVDVFFLISGFLVTGMLFRAGARGTLRVPATWGRLFWRLVPAGMTMLVTVTALGPALLPPSRWSQNLREIVASAFFLENWRLAADSVDYYANNEEASLVQHFWSLSVQGQYYLLWPLLVLGVVLLARRLGRDLRRCLMTALAIVFLVSLAYSVARTGADQPFTYFDTAARLWEFALGGLLALVIDGARLPPALRTVAGWVGVLGLVACGLLFDAGAGFPGYLALWPTVCAALVLVAGTSGSLGPGRVLASSPVRYLGSISYSLYLWHWPVLVFYLVLRERSTVGLRGGLFVIAVSVVLAVASFHLVEEPARRIRLGRPPDGRRPLRMTAAALAPVLVLATIWQVAAMRQAGAAVEVDDPNHPGAVARMPGFVYRGDPDAPVRPAHVVAQQDWVDYEFGCTRSDRRPNLERCHYVVPEGDPQRRIVVVGDSHMQQFLPALEPLARERNWQLVTMIRPGCPFSTTAESNPGEVPCIEWNQSAIAELVETRPDAVIAQGTVGVRVGLTEATRPGMVEAWQALERAGIPVVALRDNPRFDFSPPACLEAQGRDAPECLVPRDQLLAPEPPWTSAPGVPANVAFLDLSDYICTDQWCPPEIGNVVVYLDNNHLTASYARTLAPIVSSELTDTMGW